MLVLRVRVRTVGTVVCRVVINVYGSQHTNITLNVWCIEYRKGPRSSERKWRGGTRGTLVARAAANVGHGGRDSRGRVAPGEVASRQREGAEWG